MIQETHSDTGQFLPVLEETGSRKDFISLLRFRVKVFLPLSSVKIRSSSSTRRFLARCLMRIGDGYPCSSGYTDELSTPHPSIHFHTGLSVSVHCKAMDRARKIFNAVGISTTSILNKGTSTFNLKGK